MSKKRPERKKRPPAFQRRQEPRDSQVSFWVVAFLDLLGYRKVLDKLDAYPPRAEGFDMSELEAAYRRAVRVRTRLLGHMKQALSGDRSGPLPELPGMPPVSDEVKRLVLKSRRFEVVHAPGPDHVVLACSMAPAENHFPMRALATLLTATAIGMLVQLMIGSHDEEDGLPIRGGIDLAPGSLVDGFLYSPALTRAYELESTKAVYARVLIGERVQNMLQTTVKDGQSTEEARITRELASQALRMLHVDSDGATVLDFFGEEMRGSVAFAPDVQEIAQKAWIFVVGAERRARTQGNYHVAAKYAWLVDYMRPRLHLWGIEA